MLKLPQALFLLTGLALAIPSYAADTVTIATVNNSDMIRMQRLSKVFEEQIGRAHV